MLKWWIRKADFNVYAPLVCCHKTGFHKSTSVKILPTCEHSCPSDPNFLRIFWSSFYLFGKIKPPISIVQIILSNNYHLFPPLNTCSESWVFVRKFYKYSNITFKIMLLDESLYSTWEVLNCLKNKWVQSTDV